MKTLLEAEYNELVAARDERDRLHALINNPQTDEFLEAVRAEGAHQRQRWGEAHDRSKSTENWFWLVGYLAGKCLRASIIGDRKKALHHTISAGAALAQWYEAIKRDTSGAGIGEDVDLKKNDKAEAMDGGGSAVTPTTVMNVSMALSKCVVCGASGAPILFKDGCPHCRVMREAQS